MNHADFINGMFELLGGVAIWISVVKLYEEKMVRGIHWAHVAFFTLWGAWNLYFYPYYGAMFSFWAGLFLFTSNTIYVILLIFYTLKEKYENRTEDSEESAG